MRPREWLLDRWETLVFSPIVMRELRALFRKKSFFIPHLTLLILLGAATFIAGITLSATGEVAGLFMFVAMFAGAAGLLFLILPAFACTSVTQEREQRSFDLILTSTLGAFDVVWGKIIASIVVGLVILVSTLPLTGLTFLYGGIELGSIIGAYGLLLMQIVFTGTYGVYTSCISGNSRKAITSCYLGLLIVFSFFWTMFHLGALGWIFGEDFGDFRTTFDEVGWPIFLSILFLAYIPFLTLLTLAAINRLKPPQANRSTPLRVFYIILIPLWIIWMILSAKIWGPSTLDPEYLITPGIFVSLVGLFLVIGMSLEDIRPSPRVLREGERWRRGWRRAVDFLHPAHMGGPGYVQITLGLATLGILTAAWQMIDWSKDPDGARLLFKIFGIILLHLLWLNALCRLLRLRLSKTVSVVLFTLAIVGSLLITSIPHIAHVSDWTRERKASLADEISIASNAFLTIVALEDSSRQHNEDKEPKLLPVSYMVFHLGLYGTLWVLLEILGRLGLQADRRRYRQALRERDLL